MLRVRGVAPLAGIHENVAHMLLRILKMRYGKTRDR